MKIRMMVTIGLAALLASATQASQEQLAKSIHDVQLETIKTSDQLKSTLMALNALSGQTKGDLRPAFEAFTAEVAKTEAAAVVTTARVKWMDGDGQQYFTDWQKTVDGINNESLRKKAQRRLDEAKASYGKVQASLVKASDKFKPFLSDLADIQKALSSDVTASGVKAIRGTVSTANWDSKFVDQAVKTAIKEASKMEKALSTEAK
ncbi:MAG TPA: DUF2959 family protein [Verrucomicrobiota bacterium]|nr:DUF2959 family protein [Verrucomicrobiota bacterium]